MRGIVGIILVAFAAAVGAVATAAGAVKRATLGSDVYWSERPPLAPKD